MRTRRMRRCAYCLMPNLEQGHASARSTKLVRSVLRTTGIERDGTRNGKCSRRIPCAVRGAAGADFDSNVNRRGGRHAERACYNERAAGPQCLRAAAHAQEVVASTRIDGLCGAAPHGVGVLDFRTHCTIQCSKGCDSDLATRSVAAAGGLPCLLRSVSRLFHSTRDEGHSSRHKAS